MSEVVDAGAAYAAAVAPLVGSLGGGFMISKHAKAFSVDHGLRGRQGYTIGRGSVLGDVDADVVVAAFGFWPADVIRESWEAAREVIAPADAIEPYAEACRGWGRERYAGFDGAGRLAELLAAVADGTDVVGLPLFAGWRAVALPTDDEGRLSQLLHVLREHRGGLHVVATVAHGLTPLQSVLAGSGGTGNAAFFGWEEPFEDVSHLLERRAAAEATTDELAASAYDVLGHEERADLLALLTEAQAQAFPKA